MMNIKSLFLIAAAFILGGCSMIPHYFRPEAPVPAAWPTGPAYKASEANADAASVGDLNWHNFFTDPRLQGAIQTALNNNRDIRLAALNVEQARAIYGIQSAALFPSLDADATGSRQRVPGDLTSSGKPDVTSAYRVGLGVFGWEIDFFGRLRALKASALESFLATKEAHRNTQILIVSTVAVTYLNLIADRENLALAETTLKSQQHAYDLIDRRREVGLASELDLNRAQTQVDIARGDIARYTQLMAQDENALNLLLGSVAPIQRELLPVELSDISPLKPFDVGVSSDVLLRRPDILQAEDQLKAANANIGAARAALFPRISLTTSIGTASSQLSGLFKGGSGTWLFSPDISIPVFDPRLWAALDATQAQREIVIVQYEKAIQSAFREVADTLAVQGTVDDQLSAQRSLVKAASETYRLSNERYTKGIDNYLGVLDAQRSMYAAQQGLVNLNLAKLANHVRLYAVLGGGAE
jgi:outer membrane protein, multidrug efflux system